MTDDTVTAKLAEWEALAEGATEGPWEAFGTTVGANVGPGDCGGCSGLPSPRHEPACYWDEVASAARADAEFIAAARTAMPALLAFVREVRAMHVREPYVDEPSEGFCRDCQRGGAAGTWPCPTEQAARKWIGGEG